MTNQTDKVIIEGVRQDGQKFRPSDWVERLAAILSSFGGKQKLKYHQSVYPCTVKGIRSLIVDKHIETEVPEAYAFIMDFARQNQLRIQIDRRTLDHPSNPPVKERRVLGQ